MQLTFLILVLCCCIQNSTPEPPDAARRRSRYIIDNRRNALFSKKPFKVIHPPRYYKQRTERYNRDLTAEGSIPEPKFYRKFFETSLPRKVIKSYKLNGGIYRYNVSDVPHNFIQTDDIPSDVTSTTEGVSSTTDTQTEFGLPTTTSYPWEIGKTEESNQIDEKHVYETRIETVSYHQEVIFNPPKREKWYEKQEPPEENYEEAEKNYELDESVNVMSDGRMHEPENQNKFGYVVEGTNYRKYRVEERTADGFIVGEYGVVSHDDGSLRGVRYTADGDTNPKLIYETLIKFLSL